MNIFKNKNNNNNKNWTSETELMIDLGINLGIDLDTFNQIIHNFSIRWPEEFQNGTKKGGFHNLDTYYDDFLVAVITAKAKDITTNQYTDDTNKEQGILLNAIIYSGNLKAAKELCDLIMKRTQIQAENKRLLEQTKQTDKENESLTGLLYNYKS